MPGIRPCFSFFSIRTKLRIFTIFFFSALVFSRFFCTSLSLAGGAIALKVNSVFDMVSNAGFFSPYFVFQIVVLRSFTLPSKARSLRYAVIVNSKVSRLCWWACLECVSLVFLECWLECSLVFCSRCVGCLLECLPECFARVIGRVLARSLRVFCSGDSLSARSSVLNSEFL